MECEIKQTFSDFSIIHSARSRWFLSESTTSGNNRISLITNLPSTYFKRPFEGIKN